MRAATWTHEVHGDDLLVGDVVMTYSLSRRSWEAPSGGVTWTIGLITGPDSDGRREWHDPRFGLIHYSTPNYRQECWFRVRRPAAAVPVVTEPAAPAQVSAWNGRCVRCGLGTYQGLFKLEHEGGGCP